MNKDINKDLKFPLDSIAIQQLIPHRFPFLLIDKVIEYIPKTKLVAIKCVSNTDPILQGHFPFNPIFPGVLQIEAIAQASAILGKLDSPEYNSVLFAEISEARFKKPIVPGDLITINVNYLKIRIPFFWFEGQATVDGELACYAKFSAKLYMNNTNYKEL